METLQAIKQRSSTRGFKPDQIEDEKLEKILEAGCAAPIGMADFGAMHITVVQNRAILDKIDEIAVSSYKKTDLKLTYGAPTIIIVSAKNTLHTTDLLAPLNTACILDHMIIAATDLGLGSVFIVSVISIINTNPPLIEALNLPEGYRPIASIAIGTPVNYPEPKKGEKRISINAVC